LEAKKLSKEWYETGYQEKSILNIKNILWSDWRFYIIEKF